MDTTCTGLVQTVDALGTLDVCAVDDAVLRDVLVAAERVRNAAEALQAHAMVEMRQREHRADLADAVDGETFVVSAGRREEFVVDEIAAHLRCTRMAASHRFATALAAHEHAPLRDAWAQGRLDGRKVQAAGELLRATDPALAETLAAAAVAYADTHTGPQLRVWLTRRVMMADPAAAEARRQTALAGRRVSLTPLPDGVAELSAHLPAVQARQIYDTLTSVAHSTDGRDSRTLDQRRSDALFDLVTGRAEPPKVTVSVMVPASSLMQPASEPGELAGMGPLTAEAVREALGLPPNVGAAAGTTVGDELVAGRVQWRRLLTDPATGILTDISEARYRSSAQLDRAVRSRDLTCRFPGCRRPATTTRNGVDLDHTTPWPGGPTTAGNLACLCRHHHRLKHSPGWSLTGEPDGTLHWTTPTGHRFTTSPWQYADPPEGRSKGPPAEVDGAA